jgi:hypothetical protein
MAREVVIRRLVRELDLDKDQVSRAEQVVSRAQERLQNLRLQTLPEMEAILADGLAELKADLRPEQQARADELYALARDHWQIRPK